MAHTHVYPNLTLLTQYRFEMVWVDLILHGVTICMPHLLKYTLHKHQQCHIHAPLGPYEVLVMREISLQASKFLKTASSMPLKCCRQQESTTCILARRTAAYTPAQNLPPWILLSSCWQTRLWGPSASCWPSNKQLATHVRCVCLLERTAARHVGYCLITSF